MHHKALGTIRSDYDRVAEEYARYYADELRHKPLDRQFLDRFAREVKGRGETCDMGCGPGHVARYLHEGGAQVFGLDLSPKMVEKARQLNRGISFREGNMLALDIVSNSLAGITAFYAIVNLPPDSFPIVFREMLRVLQPSGLLLLSFHIGDEAFRPAELWGQKISMEFHLLPVAMVRSDLEQAGFLIEEVIEREPYAPEVEYQSRRAYVFARKPAL